MNTSVTSSARGALACRFPRWLLVPCLALLGLGLQAQSGTIRGRIINQATGYALDRAVVTVDGPDIGTVAERDGSYSLQVPSGTHTVEVKYTGLDPVRATVTVAAGATVVQDFAMTSEVYVLDQYFVKGVREGNAAALQKQRTAINPKTMVAADAFGLPAANPGELIQRLPSISVDIVGSEVRNLFLRGMNADFIAFQVDGNQMASSAGTSASRQFQIEQMGTGNVESVEVIKANTPDRDANAVAGFVNLITRRAFDAPGRRLEITGGTIARLRESSDNPYQDRLGLDIVGVRYSDVLSVFGGERNLGIAFNFNRRHSSTTQDESGAAFNFGGSGALNVTNPNNTLFRYWGTGDFYYPANSINIGLNLDYKLGADRYVYLRTAYNSNIQYQEYFRWDVQTANSTASFTPDTTSALQTALPIAGSFAQSYSSTFTKNSKNYSINPGGSFKLFGQTAQLDVDFSHSYARIYYPGWHNVISRTNAPIGWQLDFRGGDQADPVLTQGAGPSWSDPASYTPFSDAVNRWYAPDTLDALRVDFRKDFDAGTPFYVKVGLKYAVDDRAQDNNSYNLSQWTGPAGIGPYLAQSYRQVGGRYGPFPFIGIPNTGRSDDILKSGLLQRSPLDTYNSIISSRAGDARMKEEISAFYLMAGTKIAKVSVQGGLRVEQTDTTGRAWTNNSDPALAFNAALSTDQNIANAFARFAGGQVTRKGDYRTAHPAIQLVYEPLPGWLLRGSYTRSISRPPVANLLPITTANPGNSTVTQGNPDLKPFTSGNFDLSIEKYFEPVGQFSVGFFSKEISNYIVNQPAGAIPSGQDNGFNGLYAGFQLTRPTNIGFARIRGWEFNYQQQFSFLPGFLKDFGVFANETILHSEGNYGAAVPGGGVGPLNNLVPHQFNGGISYTGHGLDLRLMANIRGRHLTVFANSPVLDNYRDRRVILDFKARYTVNRNYDVFLMIDNLTDEPSNTNNVSGRELFTLTQGVGITLGATARF